MSTSTSALPFTRMWAVPSLLERSTPNSLKRSFWNSSTRTTSSSPSLTTRSHRRPQRSLCTGSSARTSGFRSLPRKRKRPKFPQHNIPTPKTNKILFLQETPAVRRRGFFIIIHLLILLSLSLNLLLILKLLLYRLFYL